jgi:hypothetical protein
VTRLSYGDDTEIRQRILDELRVDHPNGRSEPELVERLRPEIYVAPLREQIEQLWLLHEISRTPGGRYRLNICPTCDAEAYYVLGIDRFLHGDGSASRDCWTAWSQRPDD